MAAQNVPMANGKSTSKQQTVEQTYQKKSQLEHILLRPDTYIGSVEKATEQTWIYDNELDKMVQKEIEYVPGLYKIFDEILVNAADNKQRDKSMNCIKINIDAETNTISVWNNGEGIPVVEHKEEHMYVPTLIFGHLLTSSNYNDDIAKVTGGRNGYGAKLCNIFSEKFTVETAAKQYHRKFKQTWRSNMTKTSEPTIKPYTGEDFTRIEFKPDLAKFKMDNLDDDIIGLMSRRAYDVAASARGVKVILNDKPLPVKTFRDYVNLFIKGKENENGSDLKVIYENVNDRWEVAITLSDRGFQQMSFVNSIATTKGGKHVDYVADMIVKQLIEVFKKKNKGGVSIKPFQVKNHMWLFINCLIVNPTFDSQTKENMTLQMKSFGSKCPLSEKFIQQVTKSGIVEAVLSWAKFKAQTEMAKTGGKKISKLKGIPKLEDANEAGTRNALKCTLILTEGDSAKSLAVSGLGVIGRDYYGVFPLRGKLLNVREATHKQILENAEINNLIKILGLQYKKKYNCEDDMKTLRYGKIMIMTDQDQDGSHIKGLLINFIHHNWPELLKQNFLEEFITPIIKATKRGEQLSFYSLPEFEEWKQATAMYKTYRIKYYKGLGTSTSAEAKEYFNNMTRHRIRFRYSGPNDDEHIVLAFSKKHVDQRKEWLMNFMTDSKRRKEEGESDVYLYTNDTRSVTYSDFVNLELVHFSNMDNVRSIPSLVDGLKPGQRKVMFTCFKRNDKREVKVAQLAASVAEHSAYHHGETSLTMTIVNLAQNFVGSNNINLLRPLGQFGTRLNGGKDSASPRYIFTKMSPLTRLIFNPKDDPLLKHEYEDNQKIEPVWYIPIIPMVLVNGAEGIGTGWMTKIPNYNPRQIVQNLQRMLDGEEPQNMLPWYKNYKGAIEDCGDKRYVVSGEVAVIGNDKVEITELPVGTWTQTYKENVLETLLYGTEKSKNLITDYKEYNTDTTVKFIVNVGGEQLVNLQKDGLHKVFKLQTVININSMCVFDEMGCIRRFESVIDILKEFYVLRLKMYQRRKDYLEGMLEAEAAKLNQQGRFIMEKCNGTLVIENKKRKIVIDELIKRGYTPDPVAVWKKRVVVDTEVDDQDGGADQQDEAEDSDAEEESNVRKTTTTDVEDFTNLPEVKNFDYLLGMSMWMLTEEKKNQLLQQRDAKLTELKALKCKSKHDLWRDDLNEFLIQLNAVEEKERTEDTKIKGMPIKKGIGKKKTNLLETMPSPIGRRVVPIIGDDIKKRIQAAVRTKENKDKKTMKKENNDEKDEFDLMVQSKKTLKDKLGTPEDIEKKVMSRQALKPVSKFVKKLDESFSSVDGEIISSESDQDAVIDDYGKPAEKNVASKQNIPKTLLFDAIKNSNPQWNKVVDSDDDVLPSLSNSTDSHTETTIEKTTKPSKVIHNSYSDSESDAFDDNHSSTTTKSKSKNSTKASTVRKQTGPKAKKIRSKSNKKIRMYDSSDDGSVDFEKPSKKKSKKNVVSDTDSSDDSFKVKPTQPSTFRSARQQKTQAKYVFSDDSDE